MEGFVNVVHSRNRIETLKRILIHISPILKVTTIAILKDICRNSYNADFTGEQTKSSTKSDIFIPFNIPAFVAQ